MIIWSDPNDYFFGIFLTWISLVVFPGLFNPELCTVWIFFVWPFTPLPTFLTFSLPTEGKEMTEGDWGATMTRDFRGGLTVLGFRSLPSSTSFASTAASSKLEMVSDLLLDIELELALEMLGALGSQGQAWRGWDPLLGRLLHQASDQPPMVRVEEDEDDNEHATDQDAWDSQPNPFLLIVWSLWRVFAGVRPPRGWKIHEFATH